MKNKRIVDPMRCIERKMNKCPEIDSNDLEHYPLIDDDHFMYMESEYTNDMSRLLLFPYIRKNEEITYIDIYIWDCTCISTPCKRFVIDKGYRFNETDEEEFIEYMRSDVLYVYQDELNKVCEYVMSLFPEYHFIMYKTDEAGMALLHLYYASHRSGYLEILYKSGLNYLAFDSKDIPDCNYIGSSPEEIIGAPLKLLRILNQPGFSKFYTSEKTFLISKKIYCKYASYFKKRPTLIQWDYLNKIESNDNLFNKSVYKRLAVCSDRIIVSLYIEYLRLREENKDLSIGFPKPRELMDINEKLSTINRYNSRKINKKIKVKKQILNLDFSGHRYSVVVPESVNDIGREAIKQHNCLLDHIKPHSDGKTTIFFIRKSDAKNKPFVTAELVGNRVVQLLGKHNSIPNPEVYLFMEAYCAFKGISIDPVEMILEGDDYEDNITVSDKIFDYMYYHAKRESTCKRICVPMIKEDSIGMKEQDTEQLSMYDLFPDVMKVEEEYEPGSEDSLFIGLMGDMVRDHAYKNELDAFIWENMGSLFNDKDDHFSEYHDKIISIVKSMETSKRSFDLLWDIVEAYDIPEINYAVLKLYKKYLTDDEVQMLLKLLTEDIYQDIEEKWNIVHS